MFRDIDILELLPQRPPFVMVDHLTDYSETQSSCDLTVRADNVFFEKGCLAAAGLIEHIAQTCAARLGYYNKYVLKTGVRLGFIGEVKDLNIVRLPREGETDRDDNRGHAGDIRRHPRQRRSASRHRDNRHNTGLKIAQGEQTD